MRINWLLDCFIILHYNFLNLSIFDFLFVIAAWFMDCVSKMEKQLMSLAMWRHLVLNKKNILGELNLWRYTNDAAYIRYYGKFFFFIFLLHFIYLHIPVFSNLSDFNGRLFCLYEAPVFCLLMLLSKNLF